MAGEDETEDRGSHMRRWLLHFYTQEPFVPFVIRLESGFEVRVPSIELISLEPGVLVVSVYEDAEHFEVFPMDRVVSIKTGARR